jgi:hypothetical protein
MAPANGAAMVIHPVYRQSPTNKDLPSPGYAVRQIRYDSAPRRMRSDQNGLRMKIPSKKLSFIFYCARSSGCERKHSGFNFLARFHVKKAAHFIGYTGR